MTKAIKLKNLLLLEFFELLEIKQGVFFAKDTIENSLKHIRDTNVDFYTLEIYSDKVLKFGVSVWLMFLYEVVGYEYIDNIDEYKKELNQYILLPF